MEGQYWGSVILIPAFTLSNLKSSVKGLYYLIIFSEVKIFHKSKATAWKKVRLS